MARAAQAGITMDGTSPRASQESSIASSGTAKKGTRRHQHEDGADIMAGRSSLPDANMLVPLNAVVPIHPDKLRRSRRKATLSSP